MQQPQPILSNKLYTYRKVLVQEFIREFYFLLDVIEGRALKKSDFTDMILDLLKFISLGGLEAVPLPAFNFVPKSLEIVIDWLNGKRKEGNSTAVSQVDIDQEELRILLEMVALEASRRYELIIDKDLSDIPIAAVVPLAKRHAERMLEYVVRNGLELTQNNLLTGIIAGHSGAYVSGHTNTRLTLKGSGNKAKVTAEGLSGRAAFRTRDDKYWLLSDKKQAIHKQSQMPNPPPMKLSLKAKIEEAVKTIPTSLTYRKEKMYNYGYTKLKNKPNQLPLMPKYAFVTVPNAVVTAFNYQEVRDKTKLSNELLKKVEQHTPTILPVTRSEIEAYLTKNKSQKMSFNDFIRASYRPKYQNPSFVMTVFEPDNASDLDFTGIDWRQSDFSDCILNGIKLTGSLEGTRFQRSYLISADLKGINAKKTDFSGAHLEYIKAENADFTGANFTHAHLHYAKLQGANLKQIQYLGAVWIKADLTNIQADDPSAIIQEQENQRQQLADQQKQIDEIRRKEQENVSAIDDIKKFVTELDNKLQKSENVVGEQAKAQEQQAKELKSLLGEIIQERQNRLVFERYCQAELEQIKTKAEGMGAEMGSQNQQIQQLQERLEKLERAHQEHKQLLEVILERMMKKEEAQQLFQQHCKTQFDELKQDMRTSSEKIKQHQVQINKLKGDLQQELKKLQSISQVQQQKLNKITKKAQSITKEMCHSDTRVKNFTEDLESLTKQVHKYINSQTEEVRHFNDELQELQTSFEQLQQQTNPTVAPVPRSHRPLPTPPASKVIRQPGFFKPKVSENLPTLLKKALESNDQFKIQRVAGKKLQIEYVKRSSASTNLEGILRELQAYLKRDKRNLIEHAQLTIQKNILTINTQYEDDVDELIEHLQEDRVISAPNDVNNNNLNNTDNNNNNNQDKHFKTGH